MSAEETAARTELTGLPGILESALSTALVARLPANLAGAPWLCRCSALVWVARGGRSAAAALPPALGVVTAPAVVGAFVRYHDTPVGPYDEVLGVVAGRTGLRPFGSVAFMAVDSEASLVGGRTNWAMPKSLARFDGRVGAGRTMTATGDDGPHWRVGATARWAGPAVPVRAAGTARQQFPDGSLGASRLTFRGRLRPALVAVEVASPGGLAGWLRPGSHLGAVIDSATFTLAAPRFD